MDSFHPTLHLHLITSSLRSPAFVSFQLQATNTRALPVKVSRSNFKHFCLSLSLSHFMERPELKNERGRLAENKEKMAVQCARRRTLALPPIQRPPSPTANQVQLAAVAVDLNVRLRSADMPAAMQERVIRHAKVLLDANTDNKRFNPTHLAMCLKKEFDALYGPAWHCIVGKSFGSFVTHASGGFVYFSIDKLSVLLFKTEVRPVIKKSPLLLKFKT